MKRILICLDRDGTLIYDDKYYLGKTNNWKSKIRFLKNVIKGIKLLNKVPNSSIYIITNQPGVSIKDFKLLTLERAHKVMSEIIRRLHNRGVKINGYSICPHASPKYVKRKKGKKFIKKLICNCSCVKPNPGMILESLKKEGLKRNQTKIYLIGNRLTDMQAALNAGGTGILVPFKNEIEELDKVKKLKSKKIFIVKDFLEAAKKIRKLENEDNKYK